jgi:chromate reductase, NAD(P)H dehydrogenase (quinone)
MRTLRSPLRIAGSLCAVGYNRGLLRAAADVAPAGMTVTSRDLASIPLSSIPLYDADVEAHGDPQPVDALNAAVREAALPRCEWSAKWRPRG